MAKGTIAVIGGGLAGLMAALKIVDAGLSVDLFSLVPVKRSHSACAQGGINAALDTKGEGDSIDEHFDDTIYGGDFLANQHQVRGMIEAAPRIVHMFDRMGVMFNRTPEGLLDLRRFGGTQKRRTAFAGATTGQQLLYALDEQVRAKEVEGSIRVFEGWEFVSAVLYNGVCHGITAQNLASMEIKAFPADAVIIATGGCGAVFAAKVQSCRGKQRDDGRNDCRANERAAGGAGLHEQDDAVDDAHFLGIHLRNIQYGVRPLLVHVEPGCVQPDADRESL